MPSVSDTNYSARLALPDLIERGAACKLRCPMYRAGALVAPSSGTITITDAGGTEQVSAAAVTITSSVATYTYTPATTLALGEGWRVEWSLVMPDGLTHTVRNDAALVRRRLYCPITEADLYRVESGLDPAAAAPLTAKADYADVIDEAWTQVQLRLIEQGNRPNLIISPTALRQVVLDLALAMALQDVATRVTNPAHAESSRGYRAAYESAWTRLQLVYDVDDAGSADRGRRGARAGTWLGGWHGSVIAGDR